VTAEHPPGWYPLLVATASIGIANSVVFSLLSNLQDEYGFGDAGLSLIAGSGFLVGLVGQLLLAPYADRGHSKLLLLAGLALAVVGSIAFALSGSLVMLVVSRCVVGLSNSLFMPAARAIAVSVSPNKVAQRLGTMSGVELAGFVTGPVIGGFLVGPFGLKVPFLVAGAFALVAALMLAPRPLPQPPIDTVQRLAFDLLRLPRVRSGVLMSMALFLPVGFYDATLDRYLTDLGASDVLIGFSFMAYGIPFALLATTGGRLSDRTGALAGGPHRRALPWRRSPAPTGSSLRRCSSCSCRQWRAASRRWACLLRRAWSPRRRPRAGRPRRRAWPGRATC
jgi:MFS family permease